MFKLVVTVILCLSLIQTFYYTHPASYNIGWALFEKHNICNYKKKY